jgi:serine/threonine protein phosphatase PrpC
MGSTVAAMLITREHAVIAHVGDSRVYRLRDGELAQLTVDHSLLAQLTASGMAPADATNFPWRHVVTRALGTTSGEPDVQRDLARLGDVFLLCSDGLSEVLEPATIATLLDAPVERACHALVDAAYEAGSRDNISAIVVRVCE